MKSIKVWVIAMEVMKIEEAIELLKAKKEKYEKMAEAIQIVLGQHSLLLEYIRRFEGKEE